MIIEGRPRGVPGASVRYYGISQPFSLRAGETTQVEVLIGLREVPTGSRNRAAIAVDGAREVAGRIPQIDSAVVDLIFRATTASRVRLSSSSGFEDPVERPLGDPESCDAGECIYRIEGWDLDADQSTSCVGLDYCPRAVFAQLLDDFGYESEVLSTEVNVDTRPPSVDPDSFSVEYLPPNDNVLGRSVQAITEGTTVRVRFSTSEPVSTPSVDASDVQFTLTSSIGLSFVFDGVIGQPDPSTGERAVVIGMTDGAGNTAEQTRTAAFQLDVDAPGAATVDTSGAIVFRRAPWGDATSATPRFSLTGAAGAVEPGAVVRVFRGEGDLLTLIGEIPADATGAFDADLDTSDAPTVIIEVVDPAGNRGPQVAVRDGVWVASLAGKVLTDPFSNPHLVSRTPEIVPTRDQDEAPVDQSDLDALQARDSTRLRVDAVPVWRPNASGQTPPTRFGGRQGLTADWARGVVMLSHGETNDIQSSPAKDTWQLDRWGWRSYDQASNPTPASSADIAYDALRERVFMHLPDGNGDWEFDGDAWTEVTPATRSQPTGECRMDFDERLGLVICGRLNEVWSWNGERWSSITTPAAMDSIVDVVYHAALERTLVVEIETNQMRVWSWDGVAWSQPTPPPANSYRDGRAAYDRKRDRLVIYGQLSSGQAVFEWDGTSWTTTTVNGLGGVLSGFTAITYHPGRERVVWLADTQLREWDGAEWLGWTAPVSSNAPTNVVRDPISGLDLTILEEPGNTLALYDVSGVVQRRRATTAIQSLSLDANGQSVIGRSNSLTYRYNGTGFVLVSVGGPGTAGLMTRARDRSQVVFVNASGTSTWNGTSWTAAGAGLDAERVFTDPATGRAIAYDTFSQPYAWTSSGWSPLQKPPIGDGFGGGVLRGRRTKLGMDVRRRRRSAKFSHSGNRQSRAPQRIRVGFGGSTRRRPVAPGALPDEHRLVSERRRRHVRRQLRHRSERRLFPMDPRSRRGHPARPVFCLELGCGGHPDIGDRGVHRARVGLGGRRPRRWRRDGRSRAVATTNVAVGANGDRSRRERHRHARAVRRRHR